MAPRDLEVLIPGTVNATFQGKAGSDSGIKLRILRWEVNGACPRGLQCSGDKREEREM